MLFVFKSLCNNDLQCMYFTPSAVLLQIFSHSQTKTVPSALAFYTVNTLLSLLPVTISITSDVLVRTPYTYGKNLQPCRTPNTLASIIALNNFCLVFFAFFTTQLTLSVLKMPNLTITKLPSPKTFSLIFPTSSEKAVWFGRLLPIYFSWIFFVLMPLYFFPSKCENEK